MAKVNHVYNVFILGGLLGFGPLSSAVFDSAAIGPEGGGKGSKSKGTTGPIEVWKTGETAVVWQMGVGGGPAWGPSRPCQNHTTF